MGTKLVVVGGVAGGATAAARARRIDESAEITLLERGPYVSYANCGLPYYIARDITDRAQLLLQTPQSLERRYDFDVLVNTEAVEIDRAGKRLRVRGPDGEEWLGYDKLILAQGANPVLPEVQGADAEHVFRLWTVPHMDRLDGYIRDRHPRTAVVVGGGFVGLEMAEAFRKRGIDTTIVEVLPTVMAVMDPEFGRAIAHELESNGVHVATGSAVREVDEAAKTVVLADGRRVPADLVLFSVGARPELGLARRAGLDTGRSGGLVVDEQLRTSDPDIFAVGDMVETVHRVSGRPVRVPLAGPANRQGRIAASNALGRAMKYSGVLGTSVVKVFQATVAMTGLSERSARDAGLEVGVAVVHKDDHAAYYPGAKELMLKLVYDRRSARVLGAQAMGHAGVDKRIDVIATALHGRMTLEDLAELDLAYAPPYSTANDPVNVAAFVALNDLSGFSPLITADALRTALASNEPPLVLDVRTTKEYKESHLRGARHFPMQGFRHECESLPRNRRIAVVCRTGFRAHLAVRILLEHGFRDVVNVTGGHLSMIAGSGFEMEPTPQ